MTSNALPTFAGPTLTDTLLLKPSTTKKLLYISLTLRTMRIWLQSGKTSMKQLTVSSSVCPFLIAAPGTKYQCGRMRSKRGVLMRPSFWLQRRTTWTLIRLSQSLTRNFNRRQSHWTSKVHTRLARTLRRAKTFTLPLPKPLPLPTSTSMRLNFEPWPLNIHHLSLTSHLCNTTTDIAFTLKK